ncbi:MAG: sulfite exporter TauE/SafE family protein [Succinivibrionaceae bacterium]|nr:sulfite exporter TauE/SafE family protein [Succinivibrionaceae bacterium]
MVTSGLFAGFLAGLLGIGGGIIFVPVLYFVFTGIFHMAPDSAIMLATGTSLGCMIPTSLTSCLSHYRNRNMDTSLIRRWAPVLIAGVLAGSLFSRMFGGLWLSALFGVILLLSSLNSIFRAKSPPLLPAFPSMPWQMLMAAFVSFFSVMLGIGGGTLSVPLLTMCAMPTRLAIGTASAIGLFIAVPGAVSMFCFGGTLTDPNVPFGTYGKVCLTAVICIVPFSMAMAVAGAAVNRRLNQALLKRLFCVLLIITGLKMLYNAVL